MELTLAALHARAAQLDLAVTKLPLGAERIRGAKRSKELTLEATSTSLKDFSALSDSKSFSDKELAVMLGHTCLETASFLFSVGAQAEAWHEWCGLAGLSFYRGRDYSYAMELLTIGRTVVDIEVSEVLRNADLATYREQAIQFVIFRQQNGQLPSLPPVHPLDDHYASLLRALEANHAGRLRRSVSTIVKFWLDETSYGRFEPGVFPVFEPEINSVAGALVKQGFSLEFRNPAVTDFLRAALE
jgi:hypothetical protein